MSKKTDIEPPLCSPIPFRPGSNGEFAPRAPSEQDRIAEHMFRRIVDDNARKLGVDRREFVKSWCGTATALLVINQVYGCGDSGGSSGDGGFAVDAGSTIDSAQACEELSGDQFVFDVQTHHVNPTGGWRDEGTFWPAVLANFPQGSCGESDPVDCFDTNHYIREMFLNSDTAIAVLSAVPAVPDENPLSVAEAAETAQIVQMLSGSRRVVTHGLILADQGQAQLDGMQQLEEDHGVAAWKCYTQFGGWELDDPDIGIPFIERARALDVKLICAHKGLSLFGLDPAYALPRDLGVVAKAYPDVNFMVYHSGYETGVAEGPYDPSSTQGIDTLIKALLDNELGPTDNLYAELGSTWRNLMTASGDQAQHAIGKLLKHFGPDRILWGTDSIWYGSPQDQIAAFRAFQISTELQQAHDYPPLTDDAKTKILGLNAAALYGIDPDATICAIDGDALSARKAELDRPIPGFKEYGPQTRREFFAFLRGRDGMPG
jgi:hypothetical protein